MACQPRDTASLQEDPLPPPSGLGESASPGAAELCVEPALCLQPPLRPLGHDVYAVGTHLVVLAQYLEHDHHISHLNPIKNIFQSSFLYLKKIIKIIKLVKS